jgi:dihydroflavonol-4-reductase
VDHTAFVTGGTGLLGSNLVRELTRQGWKVKVLARFTGKIEQVLGGVEVERIAGDMEDVAAFAANLKGCDALFHCAAYFREYYSPGDHRAKLERINVQGTLELLNAAEQQHVGKIIYVSSSGVLGHAESSSTVDEMSPYAHHTTNLYFQSKIRAEERVLEWVKSHGTPVLLILPGWMFGPFDLAPTASGRLVQDFLARKLPAIVPGGASVVDARDVAAAMIRALSQGISGERYIVAGRLVSLEQIALTLEKLTGIHAPRLRLPYSAAIALAWLVQTAATLRGAESLLTVSGVRTMRESMEHALSSAKAERELGISFRALDQTLQDEVDWYRSRAAAGAR